MLTPPPPPSGREGGMVGGALEIDLRTVPHGLLGVLEFAGRAISLPSTLHRIKPFLPSMSTYGMYRLPSDVKLNSVRIPLPQTIA
jgi:hypothetical protein